MSRDYTQHGRRHGPDGSDPIPGGADPVVANELFGSDGATTIADADADYLSWAHASGDTLLDLTDPYHPVIAAGNGVFAVTVSVFGHALTVGGNYSLQLSVGVGYASIAQILQTSSPSIAANTFPSASISATYYMETLWGIGVAVFNNSGLSADFEIDRAIVQQIS